MAQMQKCLKECADTDRFADTNAETLAVVRAETYADAGAVRRAVCGADVRSDTFAECRAVVGADAYAEKNGRDAETLAEIGANCLCRKMAEIQTQEQRLTVAKCHKGIVLY